MIKWQRSAPSVSRVFQTQKRFYDNAAAYTTIEKGMHWKKWARQPEKRLKNKNLAPPKQMVRLYDVFPQLRVPDRTQTLDECPPRGNFIIDRSKFGNLPVYTDFKTVGGRKDCITIVRKFRGNQRELHVCLQRLLGSDVNIYSKTGNIHIHGNWKHRVQKWIADIGF